MSHQAGRSPRFAAARSVREPRPTRSLAYRETRYRLRRVGSATRSLELLVLNLILKLIALRPLLSIGIFGVPIIALILIGLFAIAALKVVAFVVIPAVLLYWLVRTVRKSRASM